MVQRQYEEGRRIDEKSGLLTTQSHEAELPAKPQSKRRHAQKLLVIALIFFVWWSATVIESLLSQTDPNHKKKPDSGDDQHINFSDITPSEKLEWHSCYGEFKCARLTVAMDYHRPLNASKDNPKVHVALVLVPGLHDDPHAHSTSPLLLNPGGPGGSGTGFTVGAGRSLQTIVGRDQDIIGFDPRGIGETVPRADCFEFSSKGKEDDYIRGDYMRMLWLTSGREIGLVNSSAVALPKLDARARALGKLCAEKDAVDGEESVLKYVSTPNVARDMVSIVDAWDEWVAGERALMGEDTASGEASEGRDEDRSAGAYSLDTKGKLVYWGFSYGTLLGATFSAMFPDRVGRVVLDGVVDADYYVSPVWAESLLDADTIFASFFTYCHAAGEKCALYRSGDKPSDIEERFQAVLTRIRKDPISFVDEYSLIPMVIYESDVRMLLFATLYSPTTTFPAVASIFDQLDRGNDKIMQSFVGMLPHGGLDLFCGTSLPPAAFPNEAQNAIMCSDKRYPLDGNVIDLEELFHKMANTSSWADVWMNLMLGCDGWPIEPRDPPMRWDDHPAHKQKPINTSFPVLFVSNTADPVTPLYAGVKMAKKFVDAGLIEQKSEGHCSLAASSECTMSKLKAYFKEGKVPAAPVESSKGLRDGKWEKCEAETWPWHTPAAVMMESEGDVGIMEAVEQVQRELVKHHKPLMGDGPLSFERLRAFDVESYKDSQA